MKENIKIILIALFALVSISTTNYPQYSKDVVFSIDNNTMTRDEFIKRFELSPFLPSASDLAEDSLQYQFMYSLIAEKVWAIEARNNGLDQKEKFKFYFQPVEQIFIRDLLFQKEIKDKIKLSAQDVTNGIYKYQIKLKAQVISSQDSVLLFNIYNGLMEGKNIDSLINIYISLTPVNSEMEIELGKLKDEEVEDLVFNLGIDEFSKPIRSEIGWVIFYIKGKGSHPISLTDQATIDKIKKIIKDRRIQKAYNKFMEELLSGKTITPDENLFYIISHEIYRVLKSKLLKNALQNKNSFTLNDNDFATIKSDLGPNTIDKVLFSVSGFDITVWDFLSDLAFKEFSIDEIESGKVSKRLASKLKTFIEEQAVTAQGIKLGLNKSPELSEELYSWKDNYLSNMLKVSYLDSIKITSEELYDYYLDTYVNNSNILLLNIQVISSENLDEIFRFIEDLKNGEDFSKVAQRNSYKDSTLNDLGETGLKPALLLGDLGLIANTLKLNEIYGPVNRGSIYSMFKIIDKKFTNDSVKMSFENSKDVIYQYLRTEKFNRLISDKTVKYALSKTITIISENISSINKNNVQLFVHRLMGFGGKIAGVPLTDYWPEWFIQYQKKLSSIP